MVIIAHNDLTLFFFLQAKQRATIKWLLSKAYNNRIPENVIEPFYKDHDVSIKYSYIIIYYRYYKYFKFIFFKCYY